MHFTKAYCMKAHFEHQKKKKTIWNKGREEVLCWFRTEVGIAVLPLY